MKTILGSLASLLLATVIASAATGCKAACKDNEQDNGGECIVKSVKRFDGTEAPAASVDYASGDSVTVNNIYGNVTVSQGPAGKVGATYQPFDWEGYDEKDLATRQMNDSLHLSQIGGGPDHTISVTRDDVSNGLGANITVFLPPEFDGAINIENQGKGPLGSNAKEFDTHVDYVGSAKSINIHGGASLSNCIVKGAASVTNSVVNCAELVDVRGVSDNFTLTSREGIGLEGASAAIELVAISSSATGGEVNSAGTINGWFPGTGNFSVQAYNANPNTTVDPGTLPTGCTAQEAAAGSKTITCGTGGPNYKLTNTAEDDIFKSGDIYLQFK